MHCVQPMKEQDLLYPFTEHDALWENSNNTSPLNGRRGEQVCETHYTGSGCCVPTGPEDSHSVNLVPMKEALKEHFYNKQQPARYRIHTLHVTKCVYKM